MIRFSTFSLRLTTCREYKLTRKNTSIVLSQSVCSSVKRGVARNTPMTVFIRMGCETPPIFKLIRPIISFMITQIMRLFQTSSGISAKARAASQCDFFLCGFKIQNIESERKKNIYEAKAEGKNMPQYVVIIIFFPGSHTATVAPQHRALSGSWQPGQWGISKRSSFASAALMPQTKCAIQQAFLHWPRAGGLSEWVAQRRLWTLHCYGSATITRHRELLSVQTMRATPRSWNALGEEDVKWSICKYSSETTSGQACIFKCLAETILCPDVLKTVCLAPCLQPPT